MNLTPPSPPSQVLHSPGLQLYMFYNRSGDLQRDSLLHLRQRASVWRPELLRGRQPVAKLPGQGNRAAPQMTATLLPSLVNNIALLCARTSVNTLSLASTLTARRVADGPILHL